MTTPRPSKAAEEAARRYEPMWDWSGSKKRTSHVRRTAFIEGAEWAGERYRPLVEAARAMFDQTGCECDSRHLHILGETPWPAPYHASDCPVYERWSPIEDQLLRTLEGMESGDERGGGE